LFSVLGTLADEYGEIGMERLTNDAIKNLLEMSKYEYHNYEADIKAALSEVKECRAIVPTPGEVAALKAKEQHISVYWKRVIEDLSGIIKAKEAEIDTLRAENEHLRKCHKSELEICEDHCDVVVKLKAEKFLHEKQSIQYQNVWIGRGHEIDRLTAELEKAWKQVHEDITTMQELQSRVERLEAENNKLHNDLWMVREVGLKL